MSPFTERDDLGAVAAHTAGVSHGPRVARVVPPTVVGEADLRPRAASSPTRAADPDVVGTVRTATVGTTPVRIAYAVYGDDRPGPTVVLVPTWSIVTSEFWKLQIGYLARHFRVVVFDGRGSGASSRPVGAAAYTDAAYADDLVAVLDATGTSSAVLVSLSCGVAWSVHVAAKHPERVLGIVAIGPSCGVSVPTPGRDHVPWDVPLDTTDGWAKYNKHFWLGGGYGEFVEFFFDRMFSEPHSTKQVEDCIAWAHEITPETLADTTAGRLGCDGAVCESIEPFARAVTCPVLVVHGSDDRVRPLAFGERLAELTRGDLVVLEGAGHGPPARDPVKVNHLLREFVERVAPPLPSSDPAAPPPARRTWTHAARRAPRVLYLSSPIGLGHAQRDVAVAAALRDLRPDVQVDWLAQHPVTRVLAQHDERVHPASAWLRNESAHIEHEAGEHDLHAFQAIRRMDAILVNNFMVFADVVADGEYDLVVGDEAWDVDHLLHENPELKRFSFAWMTDFVGWLPMPDGGAREAALTADHNAEMIEHRARFARVRDRSVFVGALDDVVDEPFGPGLPSIRSWTAENYDFAGYVTGFDAAAAADEAAAVRSSLGVRPGERLCVVSVGGSGVGEPLLRRVLAAVPAARALVPDLRFVVVAGPRIDPAALPVPDGATVLGYVPDLYRLTAACDVAVVQGGLTTCMELTALRKPFVYVPLRHHFQQTFHVRARGSRATAPGGTFRTRTRSTRTRSRRRWPTRWPRRSTTCRWSPTAPRAPPGCSPTCCESGARGARRADRAEHRGAAQAEPEPLVEPDRAGVRRRRVQQRAVAALVHVVRHVQDETRGESLAAVRGVGADRADLRPPDRLQALAGHRDEPALAPDADVPAELVGARCERPGLGPLDECQHLGHVGRAEHHGLLVGAGAQRIGLDELHAAEAPLDLPAGRQRRRVGRDGERGTGAHDVHDRVTHVGVLPVPDRGERRDLGVVPPDQVVALREPRVRPRQRVPRGVVEHVVAVRHARARRGHRLRRHLRPPSFV